MPSEIQPSPNDANSDPQRYRSPTDATTNPPIDPLLESPTLSTESDGNSCEITDQPETSKDAATNASKDVLPPLQLRND
jgi:hypothetical protein